MKAGVSSAVLVNQSYGAQRVTGQQRYAREIAGRLVNRPGFLPVGPGGFWSGSTLRVWAWLQLVLPLRAKRDLVLSMTARAPLYCRRHVLVVHDLFVLSNPEWFSRLYVLTHAPLLRLQLRTAAAVVAVSEPVAAQVRQLYSGPIAVAPNAPSEVFKATADATTAQSARGALELRGLAAGQYLLTVASLDPRKNLSRLAQAYAALSAEERTACPLVVVGGGSAVFRREDIAWSPEVVDAGYVSDDELRTLYAGSRAVVFASLAEGFGLPLVEAAAAGAQSLLISDIPVFRWICGEDAHYVDPLSVPSITAGLRAVVCEPLQPEIDLERFTWDSSASTVAELCHAVA